AALLLNSFPGLVFYFPISSPAFGLPPAPHRETGLRRAARAHPPPLTLLYAAKNTEQNHARVLAAWLAALPVTI
ncbi:DUF488 family protein, partial [Klebsiella pneumoniae subsp. pneumoniae]